MLGGKLTLNWEHSPSCMPATSKARIKISLLAAFPALNLSVETWNQGCVGKCLIASLLGVGAWGEGRLWFAAFANFCGVNIPTYSQLQITKVVSLKTELGKYMCIVNFSKPMWANSSAPLLETLELPDLKRSLQCGSSQGRSLGSPYFQHKFLCISHAYLGYAT